MWRALTPLLFGVTAAGAFFLIAITFITYDRYVIRRNEKMIDQAARTNKIVASLFPSNVRDRLLAEDEQEGESGTQTRLKNFLANDGPSKADLELEDNEAYKTRPIADLFPECSVRITMDELFANRSRGSVAYHWSLYALGSVCGYCWIHLLVKCPGA